jgi:hypothetical protein
LLSDACRERSATGCNDLPVALTIEVKLLMKARKKAVGRSGLSDISAIELSKTKI